ncbi:MAG: hypothetical protein MI717_14880 [Spirochaetales bacterium]|nr:hypothetical protein [Spirochaetales bacterium]
MKYYQKVAFVLIFCSLITSCASLGKKQAVSNGQSFIPVEEKTVEVIGTVREEVNAFSVLGFPPGLDKTLAVFSWGGNAYDRILEKAYAMGGHDVINITIDYEDISFFFLFNRRRFVINGLAVRYVDE